MKSIIESTLLTLGAVLSFALLLATSTGQAQNLSGTFTLPFEAYWGTALMAPGDYSFTFVPSSGNLYYLDIRGNAGSAFIIPQGVDRGTDSDYSQLTAITIGEKRFIQRLELKEAEVTLEFRTPKAEARSGAGAQFS